MASRPLPEPFHDGPFAVRSARGAGVGRGRLRGSDLVVPTHGARAHVEATDLTSRALGMAMGMPESRAFSHITSARLLGIPLPSRLQGLADEGPLAVTGPTGDGRPARPGITGHRGIESRLVIETKGVRVVAAPDTWCDLAALGPRWISVDDLVVAGDHIARAHDEEMKAKVRPGSCTSPGVRALHEALGRRVRPRGKVMLRQALELIRPRVKSPMESRSRLMFVRAQFPEPVVNLPILDHAGEWLAEGDLVWEAARLIGEYQGAHHGDIKQRSADSARGHLLGGHHWTLEELFSDDIYRAPRRRAALLRFAMHLDLDPSTLLIA